MTKVISLKLALAKDIDKIIQIQIFIRGIHNQSHLSLIRLPKVKIMITLIHMGLGVPFGPYYTINMKYILGREFFPISIHQSVHY